MDFATRRQLGTYDPHVKWPLRKGGKSVLAARVYVRQQRDQLLLVAIGALNRHQNQVNFGITPTLTHDEIIAVGAFAEALRDVPQQEGFPFAVKWPATPKALKKKVIC